MGFTGSELRTSTDNFYWIPINALMFSSCNDLQGMGCSTCSAWSPGQFDLTAFLSLVVYLKHAILCGQNPVIMIHV